MDGWSFSSKEEIDPTVKSLRPQGKDYHAWRFGVLVSGVYKTESMGTWEELPPVPSYHLDSSDRGSAEPAQPFHLQERTVG